MEKIRRFRKNLILTDLQIKRLYELGDFDGVDPMEHASRAIDEYLGKNHIKPKLQKHREITAEIKECSPDNNVSGAFWLSGTVALYQFSALILNGPSKTAIDKGKISKLSIWDPAVMKKTNSFITSCIVNYDRGWDIKPSKLAEPLYLRVKDLVNSSILPIQVKNL